MESSTSRMPCAEGVLGPAELAALGGEGFAFVSQAEVRRRLPFTPKALDELVGCWDRLTLDRFMSDGGRYRFRRYGSFLCEPSTGLLTQRPHEPYFQPRYINAANGGIERHFDPLEPRFVENPLLRALLLQWGAAFDRIEGAGRWIIRLHPYRIVASSGAVGLPTPEGIHRDGVDYIISMMIERENVDGGASRIYDNGARMLRQATLERALDHVVANDRQTMHDVTAVLPLRPDAPAHRDVLVVAYERLS